MHRMGLVRCTFGQLPVALGHASSGRPAAERALRVERSGPDGVVARVTLNRPDLHNAFNAELIGELRRTFYRFADEPADRLRAVVLVGDGPSFCAGADVNWMRASVGLSREQNEQDAMVMAEMFDAIDRCPAPVVARVQGAALGGGMGLCAVSDLVIAEAGAKFGFTETRLGILPAVISPFVIAKIGETHARALFPGGGGSTPRARCASASFTSRRGRRALDAAVDAAVADILAAGRTRPARPRPSFARSAACRTSRRAGTRRAGSPASARARRARKACAPSSRSGCRPGRGRGPTSTDRARDQRAIRAATWLTQRRLTTNATNATFAIRGRRDRTR